MTGSDIPEGEGPLSSAPQDSLLMKRLRDVVRAVRDSPDPLDSPVGIDFQPMSGPEHLELWRSRLARRDDGRPARIVLYVHVPFCAQVCSYCMFASTRLEAAADLDGYVEALAREAALWGEGLDRPEVSTIHVGGGTPSLLSPDQIDRAFGALRTAFPVAPGFRFGVEMHPASTTRAKAEALRRHGVDRVSLGVQSFRPEVLAAIGRRGQTADRVASAVAVVREAGIPSVNLDLLAGLPGETEESFADGIRQALALGTQTLTLNRYLVEGSPLAGAWESGPEAAAIADRMLLAADRIIRATRTPLSPPEALRLPGYGTQYVFDRAEAARTFFQEDMIGPVPSLGLGFGALSHLPGQVFSTPSGTPGDYVRALADGGLPGTVAARLSERFEWAWYVAELASRGVLQRAGFRDRFGVDLDACLGPEVEFLVRRRLLVEDRGRLNKVRHRRFTAIHLLSFLLAGPAEGPAGREFPAPADAVAASRRQYDGILDELPPSLVWCRIGLRAARAARCSGRRNRS
jgi:oxygen-independent coproporphyrinogen-3 oxidase